MNAFEKIIGYEDVKAEVYRICDSMKNPENYRKLGVVTPRGLLLCGDPGIGKTTFAKALIEESGRKTFTVRKNKPNGDFVNFIKESFDNARKEAPSIVFLDDMDKFANEDVSHRDAEEYVTVQACIDDCKDDEVFVVATVNSKYDLPDSLLRAGRFDKLIEMRNPSRADAIKIIDSFLKNKKCLGDIDAENVARMIDGRTCAELETVINEAGIYAAYAGKDYIEYEDVVKACMRMIFNAPESMDASNEFIERRIAVHEAGHAVLAEILNPGSVNLVSICRHSGSEGGITSIHQSDEFPHSKELMEHKVIGTLGGKAATELVFGVADVGCNIDLQRAYDMVEEFVDNFCTYGFDAFERGSSSNYLLETKDRMIASEMNRYYEEAKKLLAENRKMLDVFTEKLIENKTLTWKEIKEIKEQCEK